MRLLFSSVCLILVLSLASPANAQLRTDELNGSVPTQLYDTSRDVLGKIFDDDHFRMSHTYEASFSSFGGEAASMGMYTNSMMWQFNSDWAARLDVSVAQPFSQTAGFGQQETRVFVRNAEVAYRPSENMEVRFQFRQSPYGRYASPYGYNPYGHRSPYSSSFRATTGDLFWRN